ncbi:MAG: AraC family transcriptional regulator, partial [Bacteroidales bacterium]|nr:AraC family transcriptional regulator [Bacteroidales bacterium]
MIRNYILKSLCLSICLMVTVNVWGQGDFQRQRDSLQNVIKSADGEEKSNAYHRLFMLYMDNLSDDASLDALLNFSKEFEKYAKQHGNIKQQGDIMVNRMIACGRVHRYGEIEKMAPQTFAFLKKNDMKEGYYVALRQLILAYCGQNLFEKALNELQVIHKEAQQQNDIETQFNMHLLMGLTYMYQDRLSEAETHYRTSIETSKKMDKKPRSLPRVYLELCNMLQATGQFDDFFIMAEQAEDVIVYFEKESPNISRIIERNNLWSLYALAYLAQGEFDKTEHYCDLMDSLAHYTTSRINTSYNRARIMEARGEYAKALDYINYVLENDQSGSQARLRKVKILSHIENAPLTRAEIESYCSFIDSVRTTTFNAQLDEIRTQFEVEKHIAEKERTRNYLLFALGGCVLLAVVLGIWIYYSRTIVKKNRGLYRQIKEQDRLADELQAMTKQYEQMAQSAPPATEEENAAAEEEIAQLPGNRQQRQLVSRLREFLLHDRYFSHYDLDIQNIIPKMATNRTSLFEALKVVTGKTPMEYINDLRLDEAKRLLDNSDLTIESIALDCGFNTSRTFYNQ